MIDSRIKKHIVLLTDCMKDIQGGAEKQIFELAKGLSKEKFKLTIASLECEGAAPQTEIESAGCSLMTFPVKRIYGISGLIQGIKFKKFLKNKNVDILMTYHFSSDIWGTYWGHAAGVETIISNRRDMGFWRKKRHVKAYQWVNQWIKRIVVNTEAMKTHFISTEKLSDEKIQVIYNGININENNSRDLSQLRNELLIEDDDCVLMHVANIGLVKGHIYLLRAVKEILKEHSKIKLFIIGEDEAGGIVQNQTKGLELNDAVSFLGKRNDISALLQLADICVLPSLSEGMSNAIMEYMLAAKPVVATNVGGNPELVDHNQTGLLVEKEDERELKDALLTLVNDRNKREAMGKEGNKKMKEQFSMDKMISRYERLFEEVS